jgi:hypothetical protein
MKYTALFVLFFGLSQNISLQANSILDDLHDAAFLQDTIPGAVYMYDTIITFDPETYKQSVAIYRTKVDGYRYDTMMVFDPDTYEETIYIEKIPYGSQKELVEPDEGEDPMKKVVECYVLSWGPIKHNYVFGGSNQIMVNSKMVDDIMRANISWEAAETCDTIGMLENVNLFIQYYDGQLDMVVGAQSASNREKVMKNKARKKSGTMFKLDGTYMILGEETIQLPPVFFMVE